MIIKEINNNLDRQAVISFSPKLKIADFFDKFDISSVIRTRLTQKGGFCLMNFIPQVQDDDAFLQDFKKFSDSEIGDAAKVKVDVSSSPLLKAFRQMNSIPSVIIDAGIYSGGYCYVYLRFHSAEAGKVSAAIGNLQPDLERFAIRYMGESNGLIGTFQELSDILSLKYVEIAATVPPDYMNITQDQVITTLGVSWERELKYLLGDEFRAVFYDRHNIIQNKKGDVNVISQEHRIYESAFSNPLVQFMIEETSSRGIVTLGMQQKLDGRNFSFATVVPDAVLPEFFNVFRQGQEKFRPWDMKVTNVESIDSMPV